MEQLNNQRNYIVDELELTNKGMLPVCKDGCELILGEAYNPKEHGVPKDCINRLYNCLRGEDTTTFTNHLGQDGVQQAQPSVLEEPKIEYSQETIAAAQKRLEKEDVYYLLAKYCQSGKTRYIIEVIERMIKDSEIVGQKVINIVVCDNNLLLTTQTNIRLQERDSGIKSTKIASNSKKGGGGFKNYNSNKQTIINDNIILNKTCKEALFDGDINVITMCSHSKRWEDITTIVNDLTNTDYKIVLFIDEADKSISEKKVDMIHDFHRNQNVIKIVLVTATPYDVKSNSTNMSSNIDWIGEYLTKGGKMKLMPMNEKHGESYHYLTDSNKIIFEPEGITDCIEYTYRYTQLNPPQGSCIDLLPADHKQVTHENMVDAMFEFYDVAIIINSKHKEIRYSEELGGKVTKLKEKNNNIDYIGEEINEWLGKWVNDHAKNLRIFITGWHCIGRGLTYSSDKHGCYLNRIIMNHNKGLADMIQMLSRTSGYTKAEPTVITTNKIWNQVNIDHNLMGDLTQRSVDGHLSIDTSIIEGIYSILFDQFIKNRRKCYKVMTVTEAMNDKQWSGGGRRKSLKDNCFMASASLLNDGQWKNRKLSVENDALQTDNPTLDFMLKNNWALDEKSRQRFVPLNDGTWLKYWYENIQPV
jgi:hypothetical protein